MPARHQREGDPLQRHDTVHAPAGEHTQDAKNLTCSDILDLESECRDLAEALVRLRETNDALARTTRAFRTLSGSTHALICSTDEPTLLQCVCDVAVVDGGYRMAWVGYREDDEERSVIPMAYSGVEAELFTRIQVSWGDGPTAQGCAGRAIREARTVVIRDVSSEASFGAWREVAEEYGYRSVAGLPLFDHDGEVLGALLIYSAEADAFDSDETQLLEELSGHLSYGIADHRSREKRAEAERSLLASYARLENMTQDVVGAMGRIVEARDPYTQGHQARVATLAAALATEMGLSEPDVLALQMAALVHDIGKLGVPSEILTKPGALSRPEFSLIKEHSDQGYEILDGIAFEGPVAEIVRQHHERVDGSGYPRGLKGDDILVTAKILAVADVVEAMASHRPYRPAVGLAEGIQELQERSRAYDPEVVETCVRLYEEDRIDL